MSKLDRIVNKRNQNAESICPRTNFIIFLCCKLGEHGIRKGLDVNFIPINQSNGSNLHYSKINYIKFYSAQFNSQFQYNSKSASICNACILNRRR